MSIESLVKRANVLANDLQSWGLVQEAANLLRAARSVQRVNKPERVKLLRELVAEAEDRVIKPANLED